VAGGLAISAAGLGAASSLGGADGILGEVALFESVL
jgi:hypothetical protein